MPMLELIYPGETVPVLAGLPGGESLPVVTAEGLVVGRAERRACHSAGLLHPVVHLHVVSRDEKLYIQHRSESKDLYPGRWDTAVGGHVGYGETFIEALYREAWEELGLRDFNPIHVDTYIHESNSEKELVCVYAAVGNFPINPDGEEVSEGRFWPFPEIDATLKKSVFTPNFEEEYVRFKSKLISLL